jgi:hypothetical protein
MQGHISVSRISGESSLEWLIEGISESFTLEAARYGSIWWEQTPLPPALQIKVAPLYSNVQD